MTNGETEKRSWDVANKLRANSKLSAAEYSTPVLGLIFLRHADAKFTKKEKEFSEKSSGSRRKIQKISTTPSNYDDLIENNTKRIAILEKTAKLIYDEWFVKFKFPEHENVRMVDSELGKIPEGWEVKKLGDVCDFTMGQSPKSKFYNENGDGLPFHQGVTNFGSRFPTHKLYCTVDKRIANKDDILFSVRAPVGRLNIANSKMIMGRGLTAIRHKNSLQSFLFYQMKKLFSIENTLGGGTIFNSVTKEDVYKIGLLIPNNNLDVSFNEVIMSLDNEIEILLFKNQNLSKTRDLLLPKLISGQVDVSNLDIQVPEVEA
ncbi:MAG: restriction endonuclease subunit S [Nanoarchaeota archaeon]|nr:restriction endonuclease subunit S [Nanoarchaeota archaeon]